MEPDFDFPQTPAPAQWTWKTLVGMLLLMAAYVLLTASNALAQPHQTLAPLQPLVEEGLANNLGIRQQYIAQVRQQEAVRQARGLFYPNISFNARYSETDGAVINFGDITNPYNRILNAANQQLNVSRPAGTELPTNLPTDANFTLPLTQETKLTLLQPIFRPEILAGYRAQKALLKAEDANTAARKRQLIADIQTAYLNVAKTQRLLELLENTEALLAENLRTSQRLVGADRATPDAVYNARAELASVQQQQAEALRGNLAARQYLNFLLGRPLQDSVRLVDDSLLVLDASIVPREEVMSQAAARREELEQLARSLDASKQSERAASAYRMPNLGLAVDYGYQGMEYDFGKERDFMIASLSLSWTIFNGFQNDSKRQQARLDTERLSLRKEETSQQILLQASQSWDDVQVAQASLRTSKERSLAAEKNFEFVRRRYEEGLANQVEFTNARSSYTNAGINEILTHYDYLIRRVALERAAALYPLN